MASGDLNRNCSWFHGLLGGKIAYLAIIKLSRACIKICSEMTGALHLDLGIKLKHSSVHERLEEVNYTRRVCLRFIMCLEIIP